MKILNDRNIQSSQKGMENVVEGTQYDDYHIDTRGQAILDVEYIIDSIESRGNQAVLTIQCSDGTNYHTYVPLEDWKEFKDLKNDSGVTITDVWITEVEGGSYVHNSRKITSTRVNELTEQEKDDLYEVEKNEAEDYYNSLDDSDKRMLRARYGIKNVKDYVRFFIVHPNKLSDDYEFINDPRIKLNSRRPIKSGWVFISSIGDANIFEENNKYLVTLEKGANTVEEYFDDEASARDFAKEITSSFIHSARYIATDPETGEVLGSADTYEEAVNEWGEDVTITDSEAAEGQGEDMRLFQSRKPVNSGMQHKDVSNVSPDSWRDGSELPKKNFSNMSIEVFNQDGDEVFYDFEARQWYYYPTHKKALVKKWVEKKFVNSSRKITSAVDGGWEVRTSDVPKALDLFVEYFGEEDALEQIAKAMGDATLEENIDWIAQQWGFAEDIEELDDAWDKYETAKEIMGESELFNNLTQAAGYDELAEDLAFIFRMNDFREWDEVSGYDDDDEDEIDDDDKEFALYYLLSQIYGDDMAQPVENAIYDADGSVSDITDEYESEGGEYTDDEYPEFDDTELATRIVKNFIESHDIDISAIQPESSEVTNSHLFPVKTVKNILSGKWSEDYAAECIAQKQDINVGYAKQILSSWIEQYKPKLIKSGVEDETDTLNQDFNIDGDLESWAEQYATDGGKSDSVGGEMVRAAMQIVNRYNADGDMIGRGYGNESVNPAARYLIEKAEMSVNEQIQSWLDHEERADDYEYDDFIQTFTSEIEQILRENPELFQKPNSDDYWSWKTDDDLQYSFDRCYIDDGEGTQYWFEKGDDDRWVCTEIEVNPNRTYSEGDTISDGDEFIDEIDPTEEFGSFEAEGLIYEYAGDEWNDEMEQYTSWQITKVIPNNAYCDEGDTFDYYDLEPDSILGYTLYDDDGIEIDERTFLANSLIKSRFGAGSECVIEIDRHKNNKWEMVAESDDERGWTLNGTAKMFADKNEAKNSDLMKALERSGYSVNKGNLKISEA